MGDFTMPSLGADMEAGTVVEWRVQPGDAVRRGDIVAVVDTEKSTIEVEVFEDGVVTELLVPEGEEVPVGTPLARLRAEVAEPSADQPATTAPEPAPHGPSSHRVVSPLVRHRAEELHVDLATVHGTGAGASITRDDVEHAAPAEAAGATTPVRAPDERLHPAPPAPPPGGGRVRATPRARKLAAEQGIDLSGVVGRGPGGAVVGDDVPRAGGGPLPPAPADTGPKDVQTSRRAAVAALMARSKREIPHYYLSSTIDFGPARDWLDRHNGERPVTERVLPAAVLLTAVARAAIEVPAVNGHYVDGAARLQEGVDLGVAISLRGGGLIAPAIRDAHLLGVDRMMAALRDLVPRARRGVLRGAEMTDPSITVTNLGDQGVEEVLPVIYPPQVAMVGLGTIVERPWAIDGMLTIRPVVTASLAGDHRATDGHDGARFLTVLARLLQDPERLEGDDHGAH